MNLGFTFSTKYCDELKIDWEETLKFLIKSLSPKIIRLCAYWDIIEESQDKFDFSYLDKQIELIKDLNIDVVLSFGLKVPRWPEIHSPDWLNLKDKKTIKKRLFIYIEQLIEHYKSIQNIKIWQVENEPFIKFGMHPKKISKNLLKDEISLVRKLDETRLIMTTDSAEHGKWSRFNKFVDILGVNIYPKIYSNGNYKGQSMSAKEYLKKSRKLNIDLAITELQAEPWGSSENIKLQKNSWEESITPDEFLENLIFIKQLNLNFNFILLWGVEWWYFIFKNFKDDRFFKVIKDNGSF